MKASRVLNTAKGYLSIIFSFTWIVWLFLGIAAALYSLFVPPRRASARF